MFFSWIFEHFRTYKLPSVGSYFRTEKACVRGLAGGAFSIRLLNRIGQLEVLNGVDITGKGQHGISAFKHWHVRTSAIYLYNTMPKFETLAAKGHQGKFFKGCQSAVEYIRLSIPKFWLVKFN